MENRISQHQQADGPCDEREAEELWKKLAWVESDRFPLRSGPYLPLIAQALAAARADQTKKIVEGARLSAEKWQHSGTNTGRIIADGLLDFADILEQGEHTNPSPPPSE